MESSGVLASFDGGSIGGEDLGREILSMPASRRIVGDRRTAEWLESVVDEIATRRLLALEAARRGLEPLSRSETGPASRLGAARGAALSRGSAGVGEERAQGPEGEVRWKVRNVFFRWKSGEDRESILRLANEIRGRVEAGEDFGDLAARRSDSETRHHRGLIGWLWPSAVAPDLAAVLRDLPVGQVSEPVSSRDGVHVFLVEVREEAGSPSRDEEPSAATDETGASVGSAAVLSPRPRLTDATEGAIGSGDAGATRGVALAQQARRVLLEEAVDLQGPRLRRFFEEHRQRFQTRPRLRVHRFEIAHERASDGNALMAELEGLHAGGRIELAELAELARLRGGKVTDYGWQDVFAAAALQRGSVAEISELEALRCAPPRFQNGWITMLFVAQREESREMSFEDAKEIVRAAFANRYGAELLGERIESLKRDAGLTIHPDALEAWILETTRQGPTAEESPARLSEPGESL